jgi:competence protein ComGC
MLFRTDPERYGSNAWTLAEMLGVLGVISVLMATTIPSIRGMTRSSGRVAAVSEVMGLMEQARSLALAQGRPSYLVFANHTIAEDRANRAVAIYLEAEDPGDAPTLAARWRTLPVGYHFLNAPETPSLFTAPPESALIQAPQFRLPGDSILRSLPYLKFTPTGGVGHPAESKYAQLLITNHEGSTEAAAADLITVAPFTGRPKCRLVP